MIFWKRSSFRESVRHSAGCNYFFYLKALQILYFFSRGSAIEGNPHFFHTVHSFRLSTGDTQATKWLRRTRQKPGQAMKSPEQNGKSPALPQQVLPTSAGPYFFFFYNKGEKMKQVNEHTVRLCFNRNQMSPCPQAGLGSWNCSRGLDAARQDRWTEAARKVGNGCLHLHSGSCAVLDPAFAGLAQGMSRAGRARAKESRLVPLFPILSCLLGKSVRKTVAT